MHNNLKFRETAVLSCDARTLVEKITGNVMLSLGPAEIFSDERPTYRPSDSEDDLAPIDILYGCYDRSALRITIFAKNIEADASKFSDGPDDLLTVVRIHEYAHAMVHLGIHNGYVTSRLKELGPDGATDWESFRSKRDQAFSVIDEGSHEFLAQAITWACIRNDRSHRIERTFLALEKRQNEWYKLSPELKECAPLANWGNVLRTIQGDLRAFRMPPFALADGLKELVLQSGKKDRA